MEQNNSYNADQIQVLEGNKIRTFSNSPEGSLQSDFAVDAEEAADERTRWILGFDSK